MQSWREGWLGAFMVAVVVGGEFIVWLLVVVSCSEGKL